MHDMVEIKRHVNIQANQLVCPELVKRRALQIKFRFEEKERQGHKKKKPQKSERMEWDESSMEQNEAEI